MGVDHPVVSAGMGAGNADGELVGRVSEAGGLGVIGASFLDAHEVAGPVIDDPDPQRTTGARSDRVHPRLPFVEATPVRRGSTVVASLSARPSALNAASAR